jgi:hypothetical protein
MKCGLPNLQMEPTRQTVPCDDVAARAAHLERYAAWAIPPDIPMKSWIFTMLRRRVSQVRDVRRGGM